MHEEVRIDRDDHRGNKGGHHHVSDVIRNNTDDEASIHEHVVADALHE